MTSLTNLESLAYFLPELVIVISLLLIIVLDLLPKTKPYTFHLALSAIILSGICLFFTFGETEALFMGMIAIDPFSHFFKAIFLLAGTKSPPICW